MSGRGRGRVIPTRKNPDQTAENDKDRVEELVEEPEGEAIAESGGATASVPSAEAQAVAAQQFNAVPDDPAVCRGKIHGTPKLSTSPQPSKETLPLKQQFMNKIREFMYRQQRHEKCCLMGLEI